MKPLIATVFHLTLLLDKCCLLWNNYALFFGLAWIVTTVEPIFLKISYHKHKVMNTKVLPDSALKGRSFKKNEA